MNSENLHTEEFYDVARRIPESYTTYAIYGITIFILLILTLSFIIEIPETVMAEVKVTSENPPITLKAESNGKIMLLSNDRKKRCKKGEYLAVLENSANYKDVLYLNKWLAQHNIWENKNDILELLERPLLLGDIEHSFYTFKLAYIKYHLLLSNKNDYEHSANILGSELIKNYQTLTNRKKLLESYKEEKRIKAKYVKQDSILYRQHAITKDDMDKSILDYMNTQNKIVSLENEITTAELNITQGGAKINQVDDQYYSAKNDAKIQLSESYHSLIIQIKNWEKLYAFIAPGNCVIELANIISNGSFITVGEPVFNVIYENSKFYGTAMLPAEGAGDVRLGDSVNIKMALYPYQEYGSLRGCVKDISLNSIDKSYLVYIDLPFGLVSDNGIRLSFAETMYGQADIITQKKKLILKLFNRLKGATSASRIKEEQRVNEKQKNDSQQESCGQLNNDRKNINF